MKKEEVGATLVKVFDAVWVLRLMLTLLLATGVVWFVGDRILSHALGGIDGHLDSMDTTLKDTNTLADDNRDKITKIETALKASDTKFLSLLSALDKSNATQEEMLNLVANKDVMKKAEYKNYLTQYHGISEKDAESFAEITTKYLNNQMWSNIPDEFISAGMTTLPHVVRARGIIDTPQPLSNAIIWKESISDNAQSFSTKNNRFIANTKGMYFISITMIELPETRLEDDFDILLHKNGKLYEPFGGSDTTNRNFYSHSSTFLIDLKPNDFIELFLTLPKKDDSNSEWYEIYKNKENSIKLNMFIGSF